MYRKHNPFLSLVALVLLAVVLVLVCTGCAVETAPAEINDPGPRFTYEYCGKGPGSHPLYIITDTLTGAQYLAWDAYQGAAMTVLQTGEG